MNNPLLEPFETPFGVPPFGEIKNHHFLPAIEKSIEIAQAEILDIVNNSANPSFENTIVAMENAAGVMGRITPILFNLNSAETNSEIQKIAQEVSQKLAVFNNEIKQNTKLFERIKNVYDQQENIKLSPEEYMLLVKTYKGFIRSGAGLSLEDKKEFGEIIVELSGLGLKFSENVLAEINSFELEIKDFEELAGIPGDVVDRAKSLAIQKGKPNSWLFTLQMPSYIPLMENAENRELRERMFRAYGAKCFKGDDKDNQVLVKRIVKLRHKLAKLLGYESYAHFILEERMAETPESVNHFLNDLLSKVKGKVEAEFAELQDFAKQTGFNDEIQRWDWSYYSEKLKKAKFELDDQLIKPYFKLEYVINGVFKTAEKLYGLTFKPNKKIPTYHKEVRAYEVYEGEILKAILLADYHPRTGKNDGAWMTSFRDQKKVGDERIVPIISIVCNFTPSSKDMPSLLKFNEVLTLFHEFGHALHGILADTTFESLSGTNVFWDFVELPSQILENWCYEEECLNLFAKHYKTDEPIPATYIQRIKDASTFHEAYATLRQISFGLLDMSYHETNREIKDVRTHERQVMSHTDLFPEVLGTAMSTQFSHIFSGGYASGYYSYKWAEVLDADAFSLFKSRGVFDPETARSFKENVLSKGGTEPPMELYKKFRGQAPSVNALLERSGLT